MFNLTSDHLLVLERLREYEREDFGVPVTRAPHLPNLPDVCDIPATKLNGMLRAMINAGLVDTYEHPNLSGVRLYRTTAAGQAELAARDLACFPLELNLAARAASFMRCLRDPALDRPAAQRAVVDVRQALWQLADACFPGFRDTYDSRVMSNTITVPPHLPATPVSVADAADACEQAAQVIEREHPAIAATPDWKLHRPLVADLVAAAGTPPTFRLIARVMDWDQIRLCALQYNLAR